MLQVQRHAVEICERVADLSDQWRRMELYKAVVQCLERFVARMQAPGQTIDERCIIGRQGATQTRKMIVARIGVNDSWPEIGSKTQLVN
jgi:hypothetical protein